MPFQRNDLLIAVAAFAGGVMLHLADGYLTWDTRNWDPAVVWRLLPMAGLCVTLAFRRTAPRAALLVATPINAVDVVMGPAFASAVIYGDLLYAASLYGRRRTAEWVLVPAGVATVAVGVAGGLVAGLQAMVIMTAIAGMTWVFPILTAMAVREHRHTARAERLRAEQVARLAEMDRQGAVDAERTRMARELHDVVANHLSAVALHSSAVLKVRDLDRAGVDRAMQVIRENSVQGLAEMRRMISLLREGTGEEALDTPRLDGLERLVERSERDDLQASLALSGERPEMPAAVELAAYRIVQESLTNALKHAGPGRARVRLEYAPDRVVVDVRSPLGQDGSRLPGSGAGLIGMRERAAMLGGDFEAGPLDGVWRVRAELPVGLRREDA